MADVHLYKIERSPDRNGIVSYLDYICDTLNIGFENIDEENLSETLKNKIGGKNNGSK